LRRPLREDAQPVSDEDIAFISQTDAELRKSVATLSFDRQKMADRVSGDPWALVVQSHLYHDHILTLTLSENLANPRSLKLDRISFAQKMDLADALALVPQALTVFWKKLNKVRNSIAHELDYDVTQAEIDGLKMALPPHIREIADTGTLDNDRPLDLRDVLIITIFHADHNRQRLSGQRLINRKYGLMVNATVAGQEFRLDLDNP
jgi:hypothetical protein